MSLREIPKCELGDHDYERWCYETEIGQGEQDRQHEAQAVQQDFHCLSGVMTRLAALSSPQERTEAERLHDKAVRWITALAPQVRTVVNEDRAPI
jgi:hypothetical protein